METSNPFDRIVRLNPSTTTEFMANGTKYYVNRDVVTLPYERYVQYKRYMIPFMYNATPEHVDSKLEMVSEFCKDNNACDAYMHIYNLRKALREIEEKTDISYLMCTIFILRADEDVKEYSELIARQKVEDWKKEGIESLFFWTCAILTSQELAIRYSQTSLTFSEETGDLDEKKARILDVEKWSKEVLTDS